MFWFKYKSGVFFFLLFSFSGHIDHKHDDDMMRIDMDETVVQTKRVSIAPPRVSMMPALPGPSRKSVLPPRVNVIQEETNESTLTNAKVEQPEENADEAKYTGAIKKSDIYKRRPVDSPDIKPGPKKKISLEGPLSEGEPQHEDPAEFVVPAAKPKSKLTIPIFVDDEEPMENKEANSYYPNESCSTQMFNMFVKSQSTPLALKSGPTRKSEVAVRRPNLSFDEHEEAGGSPVQDENLAQLHPVKINDENAEPESLVPSGSNITHAPKQLSTIMERTENSTMSGAGSTKSSVSSPPVGDIISPMPGVASDEERFGERNMKQAVKNLTHLHLDGTSRSHAGEDSVFKVPETVAASLSHKPADPLPFEVFQEEPPTAPKPALVSPFVIHIDSTETMANVPLVSKMDLPQPVLDDKENKLQSNVDTKKDGHFQVSVSVFLSVIGKNCLLLLYMLTQKGYTKQALLLCQEEKVHSPLNFFSGPRRTNFHRNNQHDLPQCFSSSTTRPRRQFHNVFQNDHRTNKHGASSTGETTRGA